MDNLTHAFVGAALARCALPTSATRTTRRVFMAAAVAAANLPDIDVLYTWVAEPPLGYLLHHRGHSHTWPGLVVLGAIISAAIRLWPAGRRVASAHRARVVTIIVTALVSHLLLDAANVYGTHLLYPFNSRWYYGDAVFIFEPWLWLLLGVAVAMNSPGVWTRRSVWALTVVPPVALLAAGLITPGVLILLAAGGTALWVMFARRSPRQRAAVALAGTALLFVGMFGVSRMARAATVDALQTTSAGRIVDIAANPNPAVPWCWSVVTIERAADDGSLTVRRGTLSLLPDIRPAATCASHRLMTGSGPPLHPPDHGASILWNRNWRLDLVRLRELAATDCRARAWLQFGRVPFIDDTHLVDLRFDNPLGGNFSAVAIAGRGGEGCPSNLTAWEWPRADILAVP